MKNVQILTGIIVFMLISVVSFAQGPRDAQKNYQDSVKQADMQRKSDLAEVYQSKLNIVNQYSSSIDLAISNKDLVEHRLNMNATNKPLGGIGKYNRNVYFYFDSEDGNSIKKIIVFTIFDGDSRDYREFLFNDAGQVYKVNHMPDMSNPKTSKAFYYEEEQLSIYTKDGGKVYGADDANSFDEDSFKESVEWLNKAAGYAAVFKLMRSIEPAN